MPKRSFADQHDDSSDGIESQSSNEPSLQSKKVKDSHHDDDRSDEQHFNQLPQHLIFNIFDFILFPLNRYYYLSLDDLAKNNNVDFSAAFRNWDIREKIGFAKLQKLLFGYFMNDPFRKVQLLFKHIDFNYLNHPYQHSQLLTTIRLSSIKTLIWPTYYIKECTTVDFPYWNYCTSIENLMFLDISEEHSYENFMKGNNLNLKSVEFEHSDESESGDHPMIFGGKFSEFFGKFSNITSINAPYCGINDKALLAIIKELPNLEKIALHYNPVTEMSVKKLFCLENIKEISVEVSSSHNSLNVGILSDLCKPIPLEKLLLESVNDESFFKVLHQKSNLLPKLKELVVHFSQTVAEGLQIYLQQNTQLKKLELEGELNEDFIGNDPTKFHVEDLRIGASKFPLAPSIKSLGLFIADRDCVFGDLRNCLIERVSVYGLGSGKFIKQLEKPCAECLPNLKYLELGTVKEKDRYSNETIDWKAIAVNRPHLQIETEDLEGSDEFISELLKLNLFTDVSVYSCSHNALKTLKQQNKLKHLRYSRSDKEAITMLSECNSLESLELPFFEEFSYWGEEEMMELFENSKISKISFVP